MIHIRQIEVSGISDVGRFSGSLAFSPGLQVICARNAWGKSLAVTTVAWCVGAEAVFGLKDNDSSCFPSAVRDEIELEGGPVARVLSSECALTLRHRDGRTIRLVRAIRGDSDTVRVEEVQQGKVVRTSNLMARRQTMQDDHGGLQRFLFEWLDLPRVEVSTFKGVRSEVYLENLLPAFYIDQDEGWSDLQALQIGRYGQQQISEVVVEYLLGALGAVQARVARLQSFQRELVLRERARAIAEQVQGLLRKQGWRVEWSGNGSLDDVAGRWSSRTLRDLLRQEADVRLEARRSAIGERISRLRRALTEEPIDPNVASAPVAASQAVVELKEQRHRLNRELHALRTQKEQTDGLIGTIQHRIHAATDVLRLKTIGVGRIERVECPTCHRDIDAEAFGLTEQSADTVRAHIEALRRDRLLMGRNQESLESSLVTLQAELSEVDSSLRHAERSLLTVTAAVGTTREQLAKTASDLAAAEREADRVDETIEEIAELQRLIDEWIAEASSRRVPEDEATDLERRREAFEQSLRDYVVALGHSAVKPVDSNRLHVDEQYVPHLGPRRLRSLGSASDQSRLVAAYSLALAAASDSVKGLHPGFVLLDEPLQQNPDREHRNLFISFLSQQLAREGHFQTLIFTWLEKEEVEQLVSGGTRVLTPAGSHFLNLEVSGPEEGADDT